MASKERKSAFDGQSIGFIGTGQMSRALASGLLAADILETQQLIGADPFEAARREFESLTQAKTTDTNLSVVDTSSVVVLAVKPQHFENVSKQLQKADKSNVLFVSILAGVTLRQLTESLGTKRVVRVMPNTPCLIRKGASAYCGAEGASEEDLGLVQTLLESVGVAMQLPEPLLDAVTGLSGSGPAYVFQIIEGLSDGGVRMGIPRDKATLLAAQTVFGAASMVLETGDHPGVLKDRVASPGGTTIAGLHALEKGSLRATLIDAVEVATERSRELGRG